MLMSASEPITRIPQLAVTLQKATAELGFPMGSAPEVGALLATLVASRPAGSFLELGTGTGLASAWMLSGMDATSTLTTIDSDSSLVAVAEQYLGSDLRIRCHCGDGGAFLVAAQPDSYDLIFADAWPGKFTHLDEAIRALRPGGLYVIDDLLPQPNWPDDHPSKVERLMEQLRQQTDLTLTYLDWSTGVIIGAKHGFTGSV